MAWRWREEVLRGERVEGNRVLDWEGADGGTAQVTQVGPAAERRPDVGGQRADVGA